MDYANTSTVAIPIWMMAMSLLYLVAMIVFFGFLLAKYTFAADPEKNPYKSETMGLPRGTLRGALTLTLLYFTVILQIYALFYLENDTSIATFMSAFQVMLAFYFGSKVMHHLSSTEKYKSRDMAKAMSGKSDFDDSDAKG